MKATYIGMAAAAAIASIFTAQSALATGFYFGGYDVANSVAGTPDAPVSSPFVVAGQTTFYDDQAGTLPRATGTGFVTANNTSAELVLGGGPTAANYTASTPASTSVVAIRGIALTSTNGGTNTLEFNFASNYYSIASGGTAGVMSTNGIFLSGNSNWNFTKPGASASALRIQNSSQIYGNGTGTLSIPFNIANGSGGPSLSVNLTGGGKVVLGGNNDFGSNSSTAAGNFTLTNGTVDFTSTRPFGNARNQVRLNGGTLTSSTGLTLGTVYTGSNQSGLTPASVNTGFLIGGNITFSGALSWGTGTSTVALGSTTAGNGTRVITANTGGATGTTIGGVISEFNGVYGLTVAAASTGRLTLTGANTYTGPTTVQGGTLALAPAAQPAVLSGTGYADITGGKVLLGYDGGSAATPVATIKGMIDTSAASGFTTGQFRSTGIPTNRTLGYADNGTDTITVMYTVPGDADLNGTCDFNDFLVLQNNFNQPGTTTGQGNFNFDSITDFNDFLVLQNNFGSSVSGTAASVTAAQVAAIQSFAATVPEPTSLACIGLGAVAMLRRRRGM